MEVTKLNYRHEWKHIINMEDALILRARLSAVTQRDPHAPKGTYRVRSLYFDTPADRALREKLDSANRREKFRIRYYNDNTDFIRLEKKTKVNGLSQKFKTVLTKEQAERLLRGDLDWMIPTEDPLICEFYSKIRRQNLRPKTIVQYTREPFTFAPGNVRVTIDSDLRVSPHFQEFTDPRSVTIPAGNAPMVLEVKWDAFLPDIIRDALQIGDRKVTAFSKYAASRIYG